LEDQTENLKQNADDYRLNQVQAKIGNEDGKASFQQAVFSMHCHLPPED
jgi:hypothetical protein